MKKLFIIILAIIIPSIASSTNKYYILIGGVGYSSGIYSYHQIFEISYNECNIYLLNRNQLYIITRGYDKIASGGIIYKNNISIESKDKENFNKIIELSENIFSKEFNISKNEYICANWFSATAYTMIKVTDKDYYAFDYYINDKDEVESTFSFSDGEKSVIKQLNELIKPYQEKFNPNNINSQKCLDITKIISEVLDKYDDKYILFKTFINIAYINAILGSILGTPSPDLYLNRDLFPFVFEFCLYPNINTTYQYLYYFFDRNSTVSSNIIGKTLFPIIESHGNAKSKDAKLYEKSVKFMYLYGDDFQRGNILSTLRCNNNSSKDTINYCNDFQSIFDLMQDKKTFCNCSKYIDAFLNEPMELNKEK